MNLDIATFASLAYSEHYEYELREDNWLAFDLRDAEARLVRDKVLETRKCARCGKSLSGKKRRHVETCSNACRQALHRKRVREQRAAARSSQRSPARHT